MSTKIKTKSQNLMPKPKKACKEKLEVRSKHIVTNLAE